VEVAAEKKNVGAKADEFLAFTYFSPLQKASGTNELAHGDYKG
jgi:hypothetical protein